MREYRALLASCGNDSRSNGRISQSRGKSSHSSFHNFTRTSNLQTALRLKDSNRGTLRSSLYLSALRFGPFSDVSPFEAKPCSRLWDWRLGG
jgi:hypothetical protein